VRPDNRPAAARLMGFKDPAGKSFSIWDYKGVIIGVVKDFRNRPLSQAIKAARATPTRVLKYE